MNFLHVIYSPLLIFTLKCDIFEHLKSWSETILICIIAYKFIIEELMYKKVKVN